jgi:hypothetical protein
VRAFQNIIPMLGGQVQLFFKKIRLLLKRLVKFAVATGVMGAEI